MIVKVLGPGCRNCHTLVTRTRDALAELGKDAEIIEVTDVGEIAGYGLMKTPGLVIDDELVLGGKVPTVRQLTEILRGR
ncbi:thioredoxin family protein [Dietzia sp. SLG310A2-38A2]|uniref:thioredoxin family protein n=1 Tax=Dietzia sp. SLG310A2-38A2 TaxID=1630643 RepID=UPI0015F9E365|nr:thioredoxin family protein [Dietzia sp. SLG310A2-38A2]MBB1031639.1 thioredoxin family protein [Dietzia sp. SLG310A2-38A2]